MKVKETHELLLETARAESTVSYKRVIQVAELRLQGDALSGQLGRLFYEIVTSELAKDPDAPMLSAVALPGGKSLPSKGFFDLARDLGRLESTLKTDEELFFYSELSKAHEYWRNN